MSTAFRQLQKGRLQWLDTSQVERAALHRAEHGIKVDLKPPRPWKAEQVWVVGGGKKSWRVKEDSL